MRKSAEKSENGTIAAACSATGNVIQPPMIICKCVRTNEDLMNGSPEDTIFATSF
jgi:uncharacterized OB-fold protein